MPVKMAAAYRLLVRQPWKEVTTTNDIQKNLKELGWEGMIWIHVVQNGN